jgi:hemolysin activation/secretion protein
MPNAGTGRCLRVALLGLLGSVSANATTPAAVPRDHQPPGLTPPAFSTPAPATPAAPAFELPPVPRKGPLSGPRFRLQDVRVEGVTAFTEAEWRAVVSPYLGAEVGNSDLEDIRYRLTRLYVDAGYVNSGAVLPDQTITGGVVTFRVIEGRVDDITVRGTEDLDPVYVSERLRRGIQTPFNMKQLGERFQLLLNDPLIDRMDGRLRPGTEPGVGTLDVSVERASPYALSLTLDNHAPPSNGPGRATLRGVVNNAHGHGETLVIDAGKAEGYESLGVSESIPVNARDTRLLLSASRQCSEVVEDPLDALGIREKSVRLGAGVSHPVIDTLQKTMTLTGSVISHESTSYLFGNPFSFSEGSEDGVSRVIGIQLSQDYVLRKEASSLALRSTVTKGTGWWDATTRPEGPDGRFMSWLGQGQLAIRLGNEGQQLLVKGTYSAANNPLLSSQQVSIGGVSSVRGYRENTVVRDEAFFGAVEYHHPLRPLFGAVNGLQWAALGFVDYGSAWDKGERDHPDELSSLGLGMTTQWRDTLQATLYVAHSLQEVPERGEYSLQDDGIHLSVTTRLY